MKLLHYLILGSSLFLSTSSVADAKQTNIDICQVIAAFKHQDKTAIASFVVYPLQREFPIPAIHNEAEFVKRFDELFDKQLIALIANSEPHKDWAMIGSRGTMFANGEIWLDSNNRIIAITYQSSKEKVIKNRLVQAQKETLHPSLRAYQRPMLEWKTAKYHIRIDDLGNDNYRYASWSTDNPTTDKPDLVLENGKRLFEGSGGNHLYTFANGNYVYRCYVNQLGPSHAAAGTLDVFKGKDHILSDDVIEVLSR